MPIRADERHLYPTDWADIAAWVKHVRAGGRCECTGECGRSVLHLDGYDARCRNRHGERRWSSGGGDGTIVILAAAHVDQDPGNVDDDNLRAFCEGCHSAFDGLPSNRAIRETRRLIASGMGTLFDPDDVLAAAAAEAESRAAVGPPTLSVVRS